MLSPEELRMVERLIVTCGGIVSIYLGYRLFFIASVRNDSEASFKLGEAIDAGMKRVAPGIFFALFGAWILHTSLTEKVVTRSAMHVFGMNTDAVKSSMARSLEQMRGMASSLPAEQQAEFHREMGKLEAAIDNLGGAMFHAYEPNPDGIPGLLKKQLMDPDRNVAG